MKPWLQLALDTQDISIALESIERVKEQVQIIEVGTVLAFAQGIQVVKLLREKYPQHILVCDLKTTDAGTVLAEMAFSAGADWLTVSAAAHPATIAGCKQVADHYGGEIQIELYGHWTREDVCFWRDLGIKQAIYHRSRDAELAGLDWGQEDLDRMQALSELGMQLSITGGVTPENLSLFTQIKPKVFIAGRALTGTEAQGMARLFAEKIAMIWSGKE